MEILTGMFRSYLLFNKRRAKLRPYIVVSVIFHANLRFLFCLLGGESALTLKLGYNHNTLNRFKINKGLNLGVNRSIIFITAYRLNSAYKQS